MDRETAKAINNISKRMNEMERKIDAYVNKQIDDTQNMTSDAWRPNEMHEVGKIYIYNNCLYKCTVQNMNVEPTNKNFYEPKTVMEALNELKESEE